MLKCPKCYQESPDSATSCSNCGFKFTNPNLYKISDPPTDENKPLSQINKRSLNKRSPAACILLSIFTLGLYGIYWMYLLAENTHIVQNSKEGCAGEMLCLIFIPFYSLYWWYTRGQIVKSSVKYTSCDGAIYILLAVFGLAIVNMALMQNDFNRI